MDLHAEAIIDQPREQVFRVYRDHLVDLVSYLPSVRAIEVQSRKVEGERVEMVNVWHGGGDIPAALRAILSESMLSWTDYALWDTADFSCAWRSESHSLRDGMDSRGRNEFLNLGPTRMMIRIRGRIDVDGTKIPGVPRFAASKLGGLLERFLVKQVADNLKDVARGVDRYLREHPAEAPAPLR